MRPATAESRLGPGMCPALFQTLRRSDLTGSSVFRWTASPRQTNRTLSENARASALFPPRCSRGKAQNAPPFDNIRAGEAPRLTVLFRPKQVRFADRLLRKRGKRLRDIHKGRRFGLRTCQEDIGVNRISHISPFGKELCGPPMKRRLGRRQGYMAPSELQRVLQYAHQGLRSLRIAPGSDRGFAPGSGN